MLIDSHHVIRKLDENSVLSFLQANQKPLVVYGMGAAGRKVLGVLQKCRISAATVVDGSPEKHGTSINGLTIEPISKVDARYDDYILLVTIASEQLFDSVVADMHKRKIKGKILWYRNYMDIDESLPFFVVGMNEEGDNLQSAVRCAAYLDWNGAGGTCFRGLPVISLETIERNYDKANFVICDKRNEQAIVSAIRQAKMVSANIFLYYSAIFGIFSIEKYRFYPAMLRRILFPHTTCLNKIYWSFTDDKSRALFRRICKDFFYGKRELTPDVFLKIVEESYNGDKNYIPGDYAYSYAAVTKEIDCYIHFMDVLEKISVHDLRKLSLYRDGDKVGLTAKEEDVCD